MNVDLHVGVNERGVYPEVSLSSLHLHAPIVRC